MGTVCKNYIEKLKQTLQTNDYLKPPLTNMTTLPANQMRFKKYSLANGGFSNKVHLEQKYTNGISDKSCRILLW